MRLGKMPQRDSSTELRCHGRKALIGLSSEGIAYFLEAVSN
jgi:hypothetical protein